MVYLYDEALVAKLKSWTQATNMHVYAPSDSRTLFETIADEGNDDIKLPILALTRAGFTIQNPNKQPLTYDGLRVRDKETYGQQLNAIPIQIDYQLDIYTRTKKEADLYARDLIFNIINHCAVKIIVPHNGVDYEHHGHVRISNNVEDNSGITERMDFGQFTRYTLNLNIDDAYLWSAPLRGYVQVVSEGIIIRATTIDMPTTEEVIVIESENINE